MTETTCSRGTARLRIAVMRVLCLTAAVLHVSVATSPHFTCGTTDVCNLRPDQPDEYCTSGPESRCKSCADVSDRCFTERMAFNCTSYCLERERRIFLRTEKEKGCGVLGNVTNGYHNASDDSTPGDIVEISCDVGYRVEGSGVIRCLEYGIWSRDMPNCTEIHASCRRKPFIRHGKVIGDDTDLLNGETIVRFHCDTGYLPSVGRAICQQDGTWLSAMCYRGYMSEPRHESFWITGIILAAIVPTTLNFVLLFTCPAYRRRLTHITCGNSCRFSRSLTKYNNSGYISTPSADCNEPVQCVIEDSEQTCIMHRASMDNCDDITLEGHHDKHSKTDRINQTYLLPLNDNSLQHTSDISMSDSTDVKAVPSIDATPYPNDIATSRDHSCRDIASNNDGPSTERLSFNLGNLKVNINVNRHGSRNSSSPNTRSPSPRNQATNSETIAEIPDNTPFPTQASDEGVVMADYAHRPSARSNNSEQSYVKGEHSNEPCPRSGNPDEPCIRSGNSDEPCVMIGNSDGDTKTDEATTTRLSGIQLQPVDDSGQRMLALSSNTVAMSDVRRTRRR